MRNLEADWYWANKQQDGQLFGKPAVMQNGLLEGKPVPKPSTRQDLADWLNKQAAKLGIAKTETNPTGYWATADNIG